VQRVLLTRIYAAEHKCHGVGRRDHLLGGHVVEDAEREGDKDESNGGVFSVEKLLDLQNELG
jgi:hypothetical protein